MLFCKHLMIAWIGLSRKQHVTKLRISQLSIDISVSVFTNCDILRDILLHVADSPYVTAIEENYVLSTGTDNWRLEQLYAVPATSSNFHISELFLSKI